MVNICSAERYVSYFYDKYYGRVAIGVGYSINFTEIYPLVFQNDKKESIGIIAIDVVPDEERIVYIYHLGAFETGRGHGSIILKELCEQADKFKIVLKVSPNAMPNGHEPALDTNQLIRWYKKFGFTGESGLSREPFIE